MKSNIKSNLVLFLHEDHRIKCPECFETYKLFEGMKKHFKKKGIPYEKIEDDSFQDIFKTDAFPILRIETMPPKHYSGLGEIKDFASEYLNN